MAKNIRRTFSITDKRRLVELIDADVAGGMEKHAAFVKHKIGPTQYHNWKKGRAIGREVGPDAHPVRVGGTHTTIDVAGLPARPKKIKTHNKSNEFTAIQRARLIAKIEKLVAKKEMNASDAAHEVGINPSSYYLWKRRPELVKVPPKALPVALNGHAKMNGHAGPLQIMLQVSGISLQVEGHPVEISLQDAIKLQQGLGQLLSHR